MTIIDTLRETKSTLEDIKKKYRFRKARMAHKDAVELQVTLTKCRGKLEICKNDFNRSIKTQSRNITEGKNIGTDTLIQEQILWDAAIGYLLVRDAIFALETINSYDAVSHAYEMLDAAMKQISGKKSNFPGTVKIGSTHERNAYNYITSSAALKTKEELLDSFFEQLKQSGDIEELLKTTRVPGTIQAEQRHAYIGDNGYATDAQSDIADCIARLGGVPDETSSLEDLDIDMASLTKIHPPKEFR